MLIDLRHDSDRDGEPEHAETLIVGSGAVGLTMALELARDGRQVILLEAGGRSVESESQAFFKSASWRDRELSGLHLGRFRMLGGTTNFWGGQLLKFDHIVMQHRPWVADVAWPISREELDPYYARGYKLLGMEHLLADHSVWDRLNAAPPATNAALEIFFSAWAPEPNLVTLFEKEIAASRNVQVYLHAPAVALELDSIGTRVARVVVRTPRGTVRHFSGSRVILANGTIEIARLMKLPLADGRPAPWSSNAWLGKGFLDHLDCRAGQVTPLDARRFHNAFDNAYLDGIKYMPRLKFTEDIQRKRQTMNVAALFFFNSSFEEHLGNAMIFLRSLMRGRFQKHRVPDPRALLSVCRVAAPMLIRYIRYHRKSNPADRGIELRLSCEQLPIPESAIHLGETRDALGMPVVEMDWRVDGREIDTMADFAQVVADYLEQNELATVRLDPALLARDRKFLQKIEDGYHQMGMARMASTPDKGVVDRELRVFGTQNLHIAGAAVYPTTGFANPTFTAIALGLRLADGIRTGRLDYSAA